VSRRDQLGLISNLSTRALWQPPVLSGSSVSRDCVAAPSTGSFPVSRDISGSHQYSLVSCHPRCLWIKWEVGKGNENLLYTSLWDFKSSFTCRKILGDLRLYFPSERKVCCRFLLLLKIYRLGRARTRNLWVHWQAH
jgi:hypothetical protein